MIKTVSGMYSLPAQSHYKNTVTRPVLSNRSITSNSQTYLSFQGSKGEQKDSKSLGTKLTEGPAPKLIAGTVLLGIGVATKLLGWATILGAPILVPLGLVGAGTGVALMGWGAIQYFNKPKSIAIVESVDGQDQKSPSADSAIEPKQPAVTSTNVSPLPPVDESKETPPPRKSKSEKPARPVNIPEPKAKETPAPKKPKSKEPAHRANTPELPEPNGRTMDRPEPMLNTRPTGLIGPNDRAQGQPALGRENTTARRRQIIEDEALARQILADEQLALELTAQQAVTPETTPQQPAAANNGLVRVNTRAQRAAARAAQRRYAEPGLQPIAVPGFLAGENEETERGEPRNLPYAQTVGAKLGLQPAVGEEINKIYNVLMGKSPGKNPEQYSVAINSEQNVDPHYPVRDPRRFINDGVHIVLLDDDSMCEGFATIPRSKMPRNLLVNTSKDMAKCRRDHEFRLRSYLGLGRHDPLPDNQANLPNWMGDPAATPEQAKRDLVNWFRALDNSAALGDTNAGPARHLHAQERREPRQTGRHQDAAQAPQQQPVAAATHLGGTNTPVRPDAEDAVMARLLGVQEERRAEYRTQRRYVTAIPAEVRTNAATSEAIQGLKRALAAGIKPDGLHISRNGEAVNFVFSDDRIDDFVKNEYGSVQISLKPRIRFEPTPENELLLREEELASAFKLLKRERLIPAEWDFTRPTERGDRDATWKQNNNLN